MTGSWLELAAQTNRQWLNVLVACEYSGRVRDAFAMQGHNAISVDFEPTERPEGHHHQGDVMHWLGMHGEHVDLMVAHPPCTYLANSGVRWLYEQEGRWELMEEAARFFTDLLNQPIPMIAVENPIPHRHAGLPKYTQTIQPWQFGDNESKRTCLWLKGLNPLVPEVTVKPDNVAQSVHRAAPSPTRWKDRSRTFPGIARAMGQQWGNSFSGADRVPSTGRTSA